jgi:hypothetical protein
MTAFTQDAVRVSSGVTFGRACVDADSLKFNWGLMCAAMRVGNATRARRKASRPITPHMADYALPPDLAGTRAGRFYATLLAAADTDGVLPPNYVLVDLAGLSANNDVPPLLRLLVDRGFLADLQQNGNRRFVRIVATGQVLRNAGYAEDAV